MTAPTEAGAGVVPAASDSARRMHVQRITYGLMFHLLRAEFFFKLSLVRKLSHLERDLYKTSVAIAEGIDPYIASDWTGDARQRYDAEQRTTRILSRVCIVSAEKFRSAMAMATGAQP